eukprot:465174-Pelagomonas_calceolata.AAC.2
MSALLVSIAVQEPAAPADDEIFTVRDLAQNEGNQRAKKWHKRSVHTMGKGSGYTCKTCWTPRGIQKSPHSLIMPANMWLEVSIGT